MALSVESLQMLPVLVFITGLAFGSCITLLSHRLPLEKKVGMTRSACTRCDTVLPVRSLIPVVSWLAQRGRCHACAAPVHWRYPVIELATGGAFLAVFLAHGLGWPSLLLMGLTVALLVMIVVDFEHTILPDEMQLLAAALAIPYHWFFGMHIADQLLGLVAGGGTGWVLQSGYKKLRGRDGLGTGDVKFLAMAGLWLGAVGLVPLFLFSGLLGVATALLWRLRSGSPLFPFGPALALSLWILIVFPPVQNLFWTWPRLFIK